jgi:hypothetical protein
MQMQNRPDGELADRGRHNTAVDQIRRGIIPRWIRSNAVLYRAGSDPAQYNTAVELIQLGIIPRWI